MWRSTEFRISPGFFVLLGLSVLAGAGPVLPHVLLATLCHELGHLGMLGFFRVPVQRLTIGPMGAVIEAPGQARLSYGGEILAVAAGPAVNLLLAFALARVSADYLLAGANFLLGAYNLLPVPGLDGSRLLYLGAAWCTDPFAAQRLTGLVGAVTLAVLVGLSAALLWSTGGGAFCLLGVLGLVFHQIRVAKRGRKG